MPQHDVHVGEAIVPMLDDQRQVQAIGRVDYRELVIAILDRIARDVRVKLPGSAIRPAPTPPPSSPDERTWRSAAWPRRAPAAGTARRPASPPGGTRRSWRPRRPRCATDAGRRGTGRRWSPSASLDRPTQNAAAATFVVVVVRTASVVRVAHMTAHPACRPLAPGAIATQGPAFVSLLRDGLDRRLRSHVWRIR